MTAKPRLVIVGASGHGRVVADAILRAGVHELIGFLDSGKPVGPGWFDCPILGPVESAATLCHQHGIAACVIAIGHNFVRQQCVELLVRLCPQMTFATVAHPRADIAADAAVGVGTVILSGAIVGTGARIGAHCILNTGAQIDHECVLGDFSSLGPAAVTGGNVHIAELAAVGIGATVLHGRKIGRAAVVGAGALVFHDVRANWVAYGVPAKEVRRREPHDAYL